MFYDNYNYVIFSDIDILDKNDEHEHALICTKFDKIDRYYPSKILDSKTLKLLDFFGYVMAAVSKNYEISDNNNQFIFESMKEIYKDLDPPPGYIKNMGEYYGVINGSPENSFLISKKNCNVKKAIKDYFIDSVFSGDLKNLGTGHKNKGKDYIFFLYKYFFNYLNFLNGLSYLNYSSAKYDDIVQDIRKNINLEENKDYKIYNNSSIIIMTMNCLNFVKNFENSFYEFMNQINISIIPVGIILTIKGYDIYKNLSSIISPTFSTTYLDKPLIAVKCVNIEKSHNVE